MTAKKHMKLITKTWPIACLLALTSAAAHADIERLTLFTDGDTIGQFGYQLSDLQGGSTLSFSTSLMGALNGINITAKAVAPATVSLAKGAITVDAPVMQLSFFNPGSETGIFSVFKIKMMGGAMLAAEADDFTNTGGSLSITNISVDPATKGIYADLSGGNGVGSLKQTRIWDYANITGATNFKVITGPIAMNNSITGLTITEPAFELFAQSLGLTEAGRGAMLQITDYGKLDSAIKVQGLARVPPLPEPSTYVLMGLGLVGMATAAKRHRRTI